MNRFTTGKSVYVGFILVLIICAIACVPAHNVSPPTPSVPVVAPSIEVKWIKRTPK